MVGFNIFTAAPVYYAKDIVDGIVYKVSLNSNSISGGPGLIIVFGLKGLFFFGQNYTIGYLVQRLTKLRQGLFSHMVRLFFLEGRDRRPRFALHQRPECLPEHTGDWSDRPFRDIPRFFVLRGSCSTAAGSFTGNPDHHSATLLFIHIFGLRNKKAVSDRQISFSEPAPS